MQNSNTPSPSAPNGALTGYAYGYADGGLQRGIVVINSAGSKPRASEAAVSADEQTIISAEGVPMPLRSALAAHLELAGETWLVDVSSEGAAGIANTRRALQLARKLVDESEDSLNEAVRSHQAHLRQSLADLETLEADDDETDGE